MAILLDISQIIFQGCFAFKDDLTHDKLSNEEGQTKAKNIIRHVVLSQIQYYNKTYKEQYGKLVICCDGSNNWRKQVFPHYKANRKKLRNEYDIDWGFVFAFFNELINDLYNNFEFKVVKTPISEGDDVIATLTKYYQENELIDNGLCEYSQPILIVSGDHDYCQLHKYGNVTQISPRTHEEIRVEDPEREIAEKCLRGDRGDGIPNILSEDDTFTSSNKKSKPLRQTLIDKLLQEGYDHCEDEKVKKNWKRNMCLIDFRFIPKQVSDKILEIYRLPIKGSEVKVYNYLLANNCNQLLNSIENFKPNELKE